MFSTVSQWQKCSWFKHHGQPWPFFLKNLFRFSLSTLVPPTAQKHVCYVNWWLYQDRIKGDKHVWVCMVVLCSLCNGWTICPKYPFLTYDTSNRPHPTQNIELDKWLRKWMNGVQNSFKIHKCIFREYICHLQNLLGNPKLCNLILLTTFWT